ncbi:MAG: hypothetical protein IKY44_01985 [Clostridia bacterium]|nr:hypothetical protein [Clostridia bacterium]
MQNFIRKPSINLYPGIKVAKDTVIEFENENVKQKIENLEFYSVTKVKGENFESEYKTTIHLKEGDILIFEADKRGYVKPLEGIVTIEEAIDDLMNIKDLG